MKVKIVVTNITNPSYTRRKILNGQYDVDTEVELVAVPRKGEFIHTDVYEYHVKDLIHLDGKDFIIVIVDPL